MLPDVVQVSLLEQQHPEYTYYQGVWSVLKDIKEGAVTISKKIEQYLPKRPGEEADIYQLRRQKACWTPVMAKAIREYTSKLVSAPIFITGTDEGFWYDWRENTNGDGRDEQEFLLNIFSDLLYFGRLYVGIDKPATGANPRSKFEQQQLNIKPYTSIYDPLAVINWGNGWYVTRQVGFQALPLQQPKLVASWVLWDDTHITTYEAEVKLDRDGCSIKEVKVGEAWLAASHKKAVATLVKQTEHGLSKPAMVCVTLPNELWTGNNVYQKQLQHFWVESSWTDAGSVAGTIQRVFTPMPAQPQDPRYILDEPDPDDLKFDNAHVLVGSGFQFVESTGGAIANLTAQLETIERQIREIVSMAQASVNKGALQQSAASKQVDREPLQDTMKTYGNKVAKFYENVLKMVALSAGLPDNITVSGLDSYETDSLTSMLESTQELLSIEDRIPPTAMKIWYGKLTNLVAGSRSAEVDEQIQKELEDLAEQATEPTGLSADDPDAVKTLMDTYGLTEEEAKGVLSAE